MKRAWEKATKKPLEATFNFLNNVFQSREYEIISPYPTINGKIVKLCKEKRHFVLSSNFQFFSPPDPVVYQDRHYGFADPFVLKNITGTGFLKCEGVNSFVTDFSGLLASITELCTTSMSKGFFRCIQEVDLSHEGIYTFIQGSSVVCDTSLSSTLVTFKCGDVTIDVFRGSFKKQHFCIIDSMSSVDFENFKGISESILYSIGFITGHLHRNETVIVQSDTNSFENITGYYFKNLRDNVFSDMRVLWPMLQSHYDKNKLYLQKEVWSNLVFTCHRNQLFLRAIKILCEANSYPIETRAASYSVALETIKNLVIEENEEKISPIKDKPTAKLIRDSILNQLNQFDEKSFKNKEAIVNRINQLNQPTNADTFKLAFKLYNIELNELDLECLRSRNDFLHGRLPFEDEVSQRRPTELKYLTFRMHHLASILLMKYVGFTGLIVNVMKISSNQFGDKEINEEPFRSI